MTHQHGMTEDMMIQVSCVVCIGVLVVAGLICLAVSPNAHDGVLAVVPIGITALAGFPHRRQVTPSPVSVDTTISDNRMPN